MFSFFRDMIRKTITYCFLAIFGILLTAGCASVPLELVDAAADQVRYSHNIDHAEAGDPIAQYAIGKALCCSEEAILWFCRSASQEWLKQCSGWGGSTQVTLRMDQG